MAKPLYLQYQEMKGGIDWPDFQLLIAWAREQGYDGTQAVVRENANHPWGPENCRLKADGARPKVGDKGSKKEKAKSKNTDPLPQSNPADDEPEANEPTAESVAALLGD